MHFQFIQYWHILIISFINGCIACIEMPTRQSMVSEIVPPEDLAAAIPLNAMTFNIARIIGPWMGALLLAKIGPQACYLYNALSYSALIAAVLAIKYQYGGRPQRDSSIIDLVLEGARYTFKDRRLRTLFTMEGLVSIFGLAYLPLLPAIAERQLKLDKVGLGHCYASIGFGAMSALVVLTILADRPYKARIVKSAMLTIGVGLVALGLVREPMLAYPLFFLLGMAVLMQFNTTNTLFQTLSPEALRGRVLSMHIWALNGLGPVGLLGFGWLANQQWLANRVAGGMPSVTFSVIVQGLGVLLGGIWAVSYRQGLDGVA
jgi:predicted MFS family arabinose efflux permease